MRRHETKQNLSNSFSNKNHIGYGLNVNIMHGVFDIQLKEKFKLFVPGPSRFGKTVLVSKLLENMHHFSVYL